MSDDKLPGVHTGEAERLAAVRKESLDAMLQEIQDTVMTCWHVEDEARWDDLERMNVIARLARLGAAVEATGKQYGPNDKIRASIAIWNLLFPPGLPPCDK